MAWSEVVCARGQGNLRLAFHHEIQSREGASHVLPVPVAVVSGESHVECIYVEFVYRVIHGAKILINCDIPPSYVDFLPCFIIYLIYYYTICRKYTIECLFFHTSDYHLLDTFAPQLSEN